VYLSARDIVEWVWPRLSIGGIIVFDDYGFIGCDGVTKFLNEEKHKKDRLFMHNLNGHGILIKLSN
jgi:O-methyltransferase